MLSTKVMTTLLDAPYYMPDHLSQSRHCTTIRNITLTSAGILVPGRTKESIISIVIKKYFYLELESTVIVISGIPATLLILVAASAFARLSERLESWLLRHRVFGPHDS